MCDCMLDAFHLCVRDYKTSSVLPTTIVTLNNNCFMSQPITTVARIQTHDQTPLFTTVGSYNHGEKWLKK